MKTRREFLRILGIGSVGIVALPTMLLSKTKVEEISNKKRLDNLDTFIKQYNGPELNQPDNGDILGVSMKSYKGDIDNPIIIHSPETKS